jgi:deoxyribodipyrimidine photo-lyase
MSADSPHLVWFQQDLRLKDQPALTAAAANGVPVIPVYILPEDEGGWTPGAASRWWLHHSLKSLGESLEERGLRLILRRGAAEKILLELAEETRASAVFWTRRFEPAAVARQRAVAKTLKTNGIEPHAHSGTLLFEPEDIATKNGDPYRVFTPFWKACRSKAAPRAPITAPSTLNTLAKMPKSLRLSELDLLPSIHWDQGLEEEWAPGEEGAQERLRRLRKTVSHYATERDRPDHEGTSRLSPHLHFGEISPRQVWHAVREGSQSASAQTFLTELGWREFAHHALFHFPATADEPLRDDFKTFPWSRGWKNLKAWQQGLTGYPIVDAGIRQLWRTGWMHNRVRMIVGSFLTKDLLISWRQGAEWFWDTLVDADLANNTLNWQWVAGCGADAAPFFRIFNPVTQGQKFDPDGTYVRQWVPELSPLPDRWIHAPWTAPDEVMEKAGLRLGHDYPHPIVDHGEARKTALDAFRSLKTL